jgi:lipoate-protein ligase A
LNLWQKNADSPAELRANLETQITSIQEILGYLPEDKEIKTAIRKGMARTLGVEVIPGELTQEEWCLAREIADCEAEILRL